MLDRYLTNTAVLGAAGKMGSGIALLLLQEMAMVQLQKTGAAHGSRLHLIDVNDQALDSLYEYLRAQLRRYAEKKIVALRSLYQHRSDLIENTDIINAFIEEGLLNVRLDSDFQSAKDSSLIFEAIVENEKIKCEVLSQINKRCSGTPYFFTNTSSIPISVLNDKAGLNHHIIGYHFYNPPAVQRLVEVITTPSTNATLIELAYDLGTRLKKILIPSNDVAGFIGNGHFMRDLLFGIDLMKELELQVPDYQAMYMVNRVTQDFLIRPMGIFQLIDYVGIDVCQLILGIMRTHLNNEMLHSDIIDRMIAQDIRGGQHADGSQKDGFISYRKNRPDGMYSLSERRYVMFDESDWTDTCDSLLGDLPVEYYPWKELLRDPEKNMKLTSCFNQLFQQDTLGARLAKRYLTRSREIGRELVDHGIAHNIEDVNRVLENGFYHLYGTENNYVR